MGRTALALALVALAACAPKRIHEDPIIDNGDRVGSADATVTAAGERAEVRRAAMQDRVEADRAAALASCVGEVCAALARGELALGMSTQQVLAATGTTEEAWSIRRAGNATVITPVSRADRPADAVSDIGMVQLRDGVVTRYSYAEPQGVRVVSSRADVTREGRAQAMAEQLVREGDEYAARGELDMALDRYDRASILTQNDPLLDYRIATVLDKALRPIEAALRYRLFLHQLELEKIEAVGDAYAKYAQAAAYARERIIVLEKR